MTCPHDEIFLALWEEGRKGWFCTGCGQFLLEVDLKDYAVLLTGLKGLETTESQRPKRRSVRSGQSKSGGCQ